MAHRELTTKSIENVGCRPVAGWRLLPGGGGGVGRGEGDAEEAELRRKARTSASARLRPALTASSIVGRVGGRLHASLEGCIGAVSNSAISGIAVAVAHTLRDVCGASAVERVAGLVPKAHEI